ncbi:MAG: hypothetical protein K0Q94_4781, partial [Paenibacillus sp.]|nr:hypothetical protein [Paenibacillus sp.]
MTECGEEKHEYERFVRLSIHCVEVL